MDQLAGAAGGAGGLAGLVQKFAQGGHGAIDGNEAAQHYGQVAAKLSPDDVRKAAEPAIANMPGDLRSQLASMLGGALGGGGIGAGMGAMTQNPVTPGGATNGATDPGQLAAQAAQIHERDPGMLGQLLGNAPGGGLQSPMAKMLMGSLLQMAMQKFAGGANLGGLCGALGGLMGR